MTSAPFPLLILISIAVIAQGSIHERAEQHRRREFNDDKEVIAIDVLVKNPNQPSNDLDSFLDVAMIGVLFMAVTLLMQAIRYSYRKTRTALTPSSPEILV
ncbi:hypothetical protein PRIPAC_97593 [Pristionchus pacificus]|uniref:Uncharacterized protein n=1 Tax=Pristionchus pacificus TaxID=54126 RepID=A0A2A6BJK5_PRIPA|nr:hypothetical protein PRIPAC_97593 [Pristionchus pacificus]|eukprot:PDM66018.1 hypothetical protein PRIPAC_44112 [Pristionchus pacificus]